MSLPAKLVEHPAVEVTDGIYAVVGVRVINDKADRRLGQRLLAKRIARLVADAQCTLSDSLSAAGLLILFFPKPQQAVQQAVALCQPTEEGETQIAASFCIGEVDGPLAEDSILLQKVQALCGFAAGGQILLSNASFEVLRDSNAGQASFHDLGTTQLDFQLRRERVYQLFHPELPSILAHIPAEEKEPKPLPHRFGMHIGRGEQVTEIVSRINRFRLISVVGVGGIGKSHFASKVAHEFKDDVEGTHEVVWVDLAGVNTEEQFLLTLAYALGLRTKESPLLQRLLLGQLVNRKILFVFDGCDDCRAPVRDFIEIALLSNGPRFLLTLSRRLGLTDESICPLEPLQLPPSDELLQPDDLEEYESTSLFLDRARELRPSFDPSPADAEAIRRLCLRFDGHPLAIVLAAGKIKTLTPMDLLLDIEGWQSGPTRTTIHNPLHRHHHSLGEAIEWTFQSLTPAAQQLTKSLYPLRGLWSTRDAAAMADLLEHEVQELMPQLLDAGLVMLDETDARGISYRLTAQIAQIIEQKLATSEELEVLAIRHRQIMLDKLLALSDSMTGPNEVRTLDKLEMIRLDVEAALHHTLRSDAPENFVEALERSWRFWYKRNYIPAALSLIDLAVERIPDKSAYIFGRLLILGGVLATKVGQIDRAMGYLEGAYKIGSSLNNRHLLGFSQANMGTAKWANGEFEAALKFFEQAEDHVIAHAQTHNLYALYISWGTALLDAKQPDRAIEIVQRALENIEGRSENLAQWATEIQSGQVKLQSGQTAEARSDFLHSLLTANEIQDYASLARSLYWMAEAHFELGDPSLSAKLVGAARTANRTSGIDLYPINEERIARLEFRCWSALGDLAFSEAKLTGALMEPEDVLEVVTGF